MLHWIYDDACTIGSVLHCKGEFTDPKLLSNQSEVDKYKRELQKADAINLIPLREDFYLEQLPSLPLILELLEDDSTSVKLSSRGESTY